MSDLHNLYLELHLELVKNMVLYVPTILTDSGVLDEIVTEFKSLNGKDLDLKDKEKLLLFDNNMNLIVSPDFEALRPFYIKSISLQQNCFKFLELSQTLSLDSFEYAYLNYLSRLNSYINASEFLLDIFDKYCPKELLSKRTLFVMQDELFRNHLIELQQTINFIFESPEKEKNNDSENKNTTSNLDTIDENSTYDLKKKKSTKATFTKKDAIDYLLATVFKPKNK